MAYIFKTRTDGLGHARDVMRAGQERFETAPPYAGDDDSLTMDVATDAVIEVIGRACRAYDKAAAIDLLQVAAKMLDELAEQIESGEVAL